LMSGILPIASTTSLLKIMCENLCLLPNQAPTLERAWQK
jgi:hypothetical protein